MQPNPESFPIQTRNFPAINTSAAVSLTNGQESTEPVLMGKKGRFEWMSNRREWTDVAIIHAERALRDGGVSVGANEAKAISLSITSATLDFGFTLSTCKVALDVETARGYSQTYEGSNGATAGLAYLPKLACEGAIPRAVIQMLNDPKIVDYLQE